MLKIDLAGFRHFSQGFTLSLKAARFPATSTLQYPRGHRQTYATEVPGKKTALDFAPGSIWARSTTFASSAQKALLYTARFRTPLSSSKDATDLRTFRLKDVLLPPGAWFALRKSLNNLFSSHDFAIFFQLSASSASLETSPSSIQFASFNSKSTCKQGGHILRARKHRITRDLRAFFSAVDAYKSLGDKDLDRTASARGKVSYKRLKLRDFSSKEAKQTRVNFQAKTPSQGD